MESSFSNGIVIVAKIDDITSTDERGDKGEIVEVKTGKGQLLDLVYTGDVTIHDE